MMDLGPCPAGEWRTIIPKAFDADAAVDALRVWARVDEPELLSIAAIDDPASAFLVDRHSARALADLLRLWADGEGAAHV